MMEDHPMGLQDFNSRFNPGVCKTESFAPIEIPIEEGKEVIRVTSLPIEWKKIIKVLEKEIRKAQSINDIQNYFKIWQEVAIEYYKIEFKDASRREEEYDFNPKGISTSKTLLLSIIERAIDFANDYKQNIYLYKDPSKQQEITSLIQK